MLTRTLIALLIVWSIAWDARGQGERPLAPTDRADLESKARTFGALDTRQQRTVLLALMKKGPAWRSHLEQHSEEPRLKALLTALDALDGRDLQTKVLSPRESPWSRWSMSAGEVLVLRAGDHYAAVRVDSNIDLKGQRISVDVMSTKDPLLPFGGPGPTKERIEVQGRAAPIEPGRPSAYSPAEYSLQVLGQDLTLRSRGTSAFQVKLLPASFAVARSFTQDARKVKGKDPKLKYREGKDVALDGHARRIQQYLFRILEGIQPLPTYDTPDEAAYAEAEHIRVEFREDGNDAPTLLVSFPHLDSPPFGGDEAWLLQRFSERLLRMKPVETLVSCGNHEAHDQNRYWNGKEFLIPKGELQKRVRSLYPEDY